MSCSFATRTASTPNTTITIALQAASRLPASRDSLRRFRLGQRLRPRCARHDPRPRAPAPVRTDGAADASALLRSAYGLLSPRCGFVVCQDFASACCAGSLVARSGAAFGAWMYCDAAGIRHAELLGSGDDRRRRRERGDLGAQPFVPQLLVGALLREPVERERRLHREHVERDEREQARDGDDAERRTSRAASGDAGARLRAQRGGDEDARPLRAGEPNRGAGRPSG